MHLDTVPSARRPGLLQPLAVAMLACSVSAASSAADDCCSCAVDEPTTVSRPGIPCLFDVPADWKVTVGDDGALSSAVAAPACGTSCANGAPGISASFAKKPDSNADTREEIWRQIMPIVGSARCGEGTVTFFRPPGADASGPTGGVNFYVAIDGRKYSGAATFTCGQPGGWLALRELFVASFRDNPESNFPGD